VKKRISASIAALAIFIGANVALSFAGPLKFDPFNYPYKGWAWWTFNDLHKSDQVHNVALLGSSLMVAAVNNCDANFLERPLDLTEHHTSEYLNRKLENTFGGMFRTYNLSAPGQMPSDAYLTLRAMLSTAHRPDVVIYGVAPRDFIDSQMSNPTDTEPFRFLKRVVSTDDCAGGLFRDPLGRLSWFIERNLYFAHHAIDWQMLSERKVRRALAILAPVPSGTNSYSYWQRAKLLPKYKAGEINPQAVIASPLKMEDIPDRFTDNTGEYLERYKHVDRHTYKTQRYFRNKIAELCKKERIELVVINMPIAKENINVLGPQTYLDYVRELATWAQAKQVPFFELNYFHLYKKEHYHDYVHLNAYGGQKLLDDLVDSLHNNTKTNMSMQMAGRELWKQNENHKLAGTDDEDSLKALRERLVEQNMIKTSSDAKSHKKDQSKLEEILEQEKNPLKRQIGARPDKNTEIDEPGVPM
jgi:hypothetical protein